MMGIHVGFGFGVSRPAEADVILFFGKPGARPTMQPSPWLVMTWIQSTAPPAARKSSVLAL